MKAFALAAALSLGLAASLGAQCTPPTPNPPKFDALVVRPAAQPNTGRKTTVGRVYYPGSTLIQMIADAYGLSRASLDQAPEFKAPDWITKDNFYLEGTAEGASVDTLHQMLQAALADKFKLAVHCGKVEGPGFLLTPVGSGPTPVDASFVPEDPRALYPAPVFIFHIAQIVKGPVVDQAGLHGSYYWDLPNFCSMVYYSLLKGPPAESPDCGAKPLFADLMKEHFHLNVELKNKLPVDMLIIDHAERPVGDPE